MLNLILDSYLLIDNIFNFANPVYTDTLNDSSVKVNLIKANFQSNNLENHIYNYLDLYYDYLFKNNWSYLLSVNILSYSLKQYFSLFVFLRIFVKVNILLFILYTIFFLTYLENYVKQMFYLNTLTRLFILNESEKEVGPVDDFFFFAILFILTLSSFVLVSFLLVLCHSNIFIWTFVSLLLVSVLILTVPVNLFMDFGISYFVYIRGSASSGSLIRELLFDVISTATVFIRFVIQNIRFLFIFSAIFELLEWVFSNNSSLFLMNYYTNKNIFVDFTNTSYLFSNKNTNLIIINSILFVLLYFYYFLHLLFLLLVQISIYIGISVWLFFFLYSTRFMGKYEKFFVFKR